MILAASHPLGGPGLADPERGQDFQDVLGGGGVHPLGADHWSGIGLERAHPLPGMLGARPAVPVHPDIAGGTGGEGGRCRYDLPDRDRIGAMLDLLPVLGGAFPRLSQPHVGEAARAHLPALAMKGEA